MAKCSVVLAAGAAILLTSAGCGSGDGAASSAAHPSGGTHSGSSAPVSRTPDLDAVGVIGHSGATGADSAGDGSDIRANSWATGTNPEVQSIYLRLLADHPDLEDHNWNEAISGSDVTSLMYQARALMRYDPVPDIVFVQSIDNDIRCDGTDEQNYASFRQAIQEVVDYLEHADPGVRLFFVDQSASVQEYDDVLQSIPHGTDHVAGTGPCDAYTPGGRRRPDREAYLQNVIDNYFQQLVEVCAAARSCATDEGALQQFGLEPQDLTPDLNHMTPSGLAKEAAIVWDQLPAEWKR